MTAETPLPRFLREVDAAEQLWRNREVRYPREDAVPWMPFAIPQFVALLTEAVMACARPVNLIRGPQLRFLDVGCGPGTKCMIAERLFGMDAYGIDIVPRFVGEAQSHGVNAIVADAFEFGAQQPPMMSALEGSIDGSYDRFDVVLVNRPSSLQDELEKLVLDRMAPDSVLIAVNWRNNPGKNGWIDHYQEYGEPVCGVWIKP